MARPINPEKAEGIVAAYAADEGATIASIAEVYEVKESTVREALEAHGIALRPEDGATDEELGMGQDFTSSDAFREAVRAAVAAEMAKLQVPQAATASAAGGEWGEFMQRLEKLTNSLDVQKPGYQKPLTPDEIASRKEGHDAFFALLKDVRRNVAEYGKQKAVQLGLVPEYIVGEKGFYGNTASGETLFMPGQRLYLTVAPPEDFLPCNEIAGAIMQAQMRWLGEPTPSIEELVAQAMQRAKGEDPTFVTANEAPVHADDATLVEGAETVDVGPRRTMGTTVQEQRAKPGFRAPGQTTAPRGPVFVGD